MPGKKPNIVGRLGEEIVRKILKAEFSKIADVAKENEIFEVKTTTTKKALVERNQLERMVKQGQKNLKDSKIRKKYVFVFLDNEKADIFVVDPRKILNLSERFKSVKWQWRGSQKRIKKMAKIFENASHLVKKGKQKQLFPGKGDAIEKFEEGCRIEVLTIPKSELGKIAERKISKKLKEIKVELGDDPKAFL